METSIFAAIADAILGFSLISGRIEKSVLTAPMLFVGFGLLMGTEGLGVIDISLESGLVEIVAELTLMLVLFTDASRIDLGMLRREHNVPVRMLAIGLPLCIGAGTGVALLLLPDFTLWEAAVVATVLAPTDAALGQAVVSNMRVPVRIRQALNVESGLNDGIVLPILLLFIALVEASASGSDWLGWIGFAAAQVTLGPLVGVGIGYFGSKVLERAMNAGWISPPFQQLAAIGLALCAYSGRDGIADFATTDRTGHS